MAFCELKYFSKALQKATAVNVILPEKYTDAPLAVLYLLHGLSDDHTAWQRRTSIERYVDSLPLIVVMPDSGRGFYTDAIQGMAWETAIIRDLVGYIDAVFRTNPCREARCLAGLSMGGYGAIKLALKYPEMFCSAVSHSGALGFSHWPLNPNDVPGNEWGTEMIRIVGPDSSGGPNDLYALSGAVSQDKKPALMIDCGFDDFLLQDNRAFHGHLQTLGYDHIYNEHPGAHTWEYWDKHIQDAITFLAKQLGLAAGPA